MSQEPKRKHSKARKRTRRASINLEALGLVECTNCHKLTVPHMVCKNCGFYKGMEIKSTSKVQITKA